MTRQSVYRQAQLAAGKCAIGCGRPRWGPRTTCPDCTLRRRAVRRQYYRNRRRACGGLMTEE